MPRAGCSYFGVRILRHVQRDLEDIAGRGYTGVLHTFSENDLAYYRGTMKRIVEASHAVGLEVQVGPWGLGRTFGGEAESRFVTMRPDACQVLDDGRRVAAGCLNNPVYREFCREWADAALELGADKVFWDEPHWIVPAHVGVDDPERWACTCDVCREQFGGPMDTLTPQVEAFREASLVDFLREMTVHVEERGGRTTICLLPLVEGPHGIGDWDAVASLPGLATLATDPYWKSFGEPAGPFVERFARLVAETANRNGVESQLWVPSFGLRRDDIPDLEAAVSATRGAGVDDVWTWGYEACGHMTSLATPDAPLVWEAVTAALTGRGATVVTEHARADLLDLDLRPTRELVRLQNEQDRTVPAAVASAGDQIALAIDAIVDRLRDGGRLIYVGAGTSGRLAALDAAECGPTFSTEVLALVPVSDAGEDDTQAGLSGLESLSVSSADVVVAVSASGTTPYTVAGLERARELGALTVALVCVPRTKLGSLAKHEIAVDVGPELIAGSTRLKAGTAQKLVLNTISTVSMVRLGKTFGNLMVDVHAENEKLRARARRAVAIATGASADAVDEAIAAANGDTKVALVALAAGVDVDSARARLAESGGSVREALDVVG
jgi:N-acetylmuramic acid 6-phosphate etherase